MADFDWPDDLEPYAQSFYLQPHTGGTESPFSRSRKVYGLSAPRWVTRLSFRGGYDGSDGVAAFGPRLDALLAKLKGGQNRAAIFDFRRTELRGEGVTVASGNQFAEAGATSINLTGFRPGSVAALAGDYIGGDGRPHIITENATADASGMVAVSFEPPLINDLVGGAATLGSPAGMFRLTSDDAGDNATEVGALAQYGLEFVEDTTGLATDAFSPAAAVAGMDAVVWDLDAWERDLYQDVAKTTPVTAPGQTVRCFANRLGDDSWDLIWAGASACTLEIEDGVPRILGGNNKALHTRGNHTVSVPTFMVAGLDRNAAGGPRFGAFKYATFFYYFVAQTLGRSAAYLQGPSHAPLYTTTPFYTARNTDQMVLDTMLVAGEVDIRLNAGGYEAGNSPSATTWANGESLTDVMFGFNLSTQNGLDPLLGDANATSGAVSFFGGAVILGEPEQELRDKLVRYFQRQIEPEIRATDKVILIIGDSTGDDVSSADSDVTNEMFLRWASEATADYLPDLNPDATIFYRNYASRGQQYGGYRKLVEGSGDRRIFVINASVPGSQPSYPMGARFADMIGFLPHVDEVIWNHGHNMFTSASDPNGLLRLGEWLDAMDKVRMQFPEAAHLPIRTHPHMAAGNNTIESPVFSLDSAAALYGDMTLVDIYSVWLAARPQPTWHVGDFVHPSATGVTQQLAVFAPAYAAWVRPTSITPALILQTTPTNILTNGDFSSFSGSVPTGWTFTGTGTIERSTAQVDRGDASSVKLAETGATSYISQTINAIPYRGQTLVVAVRQFIESGQTSTGRLQLFSDGTGAVSTGSWVYDSSAQPRGAWRWAYLHIPVPADATFVTLRLFAASGQTGTVYYGRAIMAVGEEPKDIA